MASGTTGQGARVLDLVFRHQTAADRFLVAGGLVAHGGDVLARPEDPLGVTVAVEAPIHLQRVFLPCERHPIHPAMATLAADTLIDVNAVIEIDEIR